MNQGHVPSDVAAIRTEINNFLNTKDKEGRIVGNATTGVCLSSRLKPSAVRVLARLVEAWDHGSQPAPAWVTNGELLQATCGGNRFGARLKEIRDAGIFIACDRVGVGKTRYGIGVASLQPARELLAQSSDNGPRDNE